jgi:hypothetical protein
MAQFKTSCFIILLIFSSLSTIYAENTTINVNLHVNDSILNKTKAEIQQNIQNKTMSIFKDVKEIKYKYYIYDERKKYDMFRADSHDVDVSIISTHDNSSIALAYQPRNFIIYDTIFMKIYNTNKNNLTLKLTLNDGFITNYTIKSEYDIYKFEFADNVKKLRIQLIQENKTIFDTGKLTVIHMNFIDWYEENNKDVVSIEKGYLILSNIWYMLSGGVLALVLCVLIARYLKKKKERQIIVGW